jgi:hypothetical protein
VKVVYETGKERKIFFYKVAGFCKQKTKFLDVEEKLSSYLNERWQFGYVVSNVPIEGIRNCKRNWNLGFHWS